jgi:hypothetical protein
MTSPSSDEPLDEDELLHREVERLLDMWDDEPSFQKLKKGGKGWS